MKKNSRERGKDSYRRRYGWRSPRSVILILCEGEKTERIYFNGLKDKWSLSTAEIEVIGVGMTPKRVVEEAIRLKNERLRSARKGGNVKYDEVWAVFDRDAHSDLHDALQLAKGKKICTALSTPCFEIWYLFHYAYTTRAFQNCDELIPILKKHIPDYAKETDYTATLIAKLEDALKRAKQLRTHNAKSGTTCPATSVDLLVERMKKIADKEDCR